MTTASRSNGLVVTLRPWRPDEADWYLAARDEEIIRWTRESPTMDRDQCAQALGGKPGSAHRALAVVDINSGALLGNLGVAIAGCEAELSYWIAADSRGNGAATAALTTGTQMALNSREVTACFLLIHPDNEASLRVARAAGYEYAGMRLGPLECSGADGRVAVYRYTAEFSHHRASPKPVS